MNSRKTYYDDLWKWDVYANVRGNTEGIKPNYSSTTGPMHYKQSFVLCRYLLKQKRNNSTKTCYDDSWTWDVYAKVNGNTNGINTFDSSRRVTNACQQALFFSVSIFIKKTMNSKQKAIIWRFVNMRFIRPSKGEHKWNQHTSFFKKYDQGSSKRFLFVCRYSLNKKMTSKQIYYDDSWKWDVYANIKGNTHGIKQFHCSTSTTKACQNYLFCSVSIFITKIKRIQNRHIMTDV